MQVEYHPDAEQELFEAAMYLEKETPELSKAFAAEYLNALHLIKRDPEVYRIILPGVRKLNLRRFRYGIIYRVNSPTIQILAVMHLSRKPNYWKQRIQ